ncbi:MAG TPA: hypothetical protein VGD37_15065 [Kofleriaceae bacterium]|jgi:hypothetical protein
MIKRCMAVFALFSATAVAEPRPAPSRPAPKIAGTFGFDVFQPKQKCAKVAGALLTKLTKGYRCTEAGNDGQTGSGVVSVASCTVKKGAGSEYMLFTTAADCNKERETQLANAE